MRSSLLYETVSIGDPSLLTNSRPPSDVDTRVVRSVRSSVRLRANNESLRRQRVSRKKLRANEFHDERISREAFLFLSRNPVVDAPRFVRPVKSTSAGGTINSARTGTRPRRVRETTNNRLSRVGSGRRVSRDPFPRLVTELVMQTGSISETVAVYGSGGERIARRGIQSVADATSYATQRLKRKRFGAFKCRWYAAVSYR